MDGRIICPNCFNEEFLSDDVMIFDISCSQCDSRFCGECLLEPHYPASCGERYLWDSGDWIPAARERVDLCSSIWDHFNMYMSTVLGVPEQDDVFRSHRCAILEAISFAKWLRVHCITHTLLALRLALPQTILYHRIRGAVRHCEEPDLRIFRVRHLAGLVLDINCELPFLRRITFPGFPRYEDFRTVQELEQELIAVNVTTCWWSVMVSIISL